MATTTPTTPGDPGNIVSPDPGDNYDLVIDLGTTADSVQTALDETSDTIRLKANYGRGTTAERTAALAEFSDGAVWYDTDLGKEFRRLSGSWVEGSGGGAYNYVWANATERGAQTGMVAGEKGYQTDTAVEYKYNGTVWVVMNPVYCVVRKSANQTLTTTATPLIWDVETSDPFGMHDNVTNNTRIYCVKAGLHIVTVPIYNNNTSGFGTLQARLNGTSDIPASQVRYLSNSSVGTPLFSSFPVILNVGDYIEIMVLHSTSSGVVVGGTGVQAAQCAVYYVS